LTKAKADFDKGEYRWVAEVMKRAAFANSDNAELPPMPMSSLAIRPWRERWCHWQRRAPQNRL
jgi:hypothetical protein